jgi:hypothetical protein
VDRSWDFRNRANRHMNVEIGAEAAQFPEKKFINGIAFAVRKLFLSFIRFTDFSSLYAISGGRQQS